MPSIETQSSAYVGDPVYKVRQDAAFFADYYSGQVTTYGGEAYEILYSGVSNGQLRLQYREYVQPATSQKGSSTAMLQRPSFSQELTYDFDGNPKQISVKSVLIDVVSADQDEIIYTVKSGFREEAKMEASAQCKPLDSACWKAVRDM